MTLSFRDVTIALFEVEIEAYESLLAHEREHGNVLERLFPDTMPAGFHADAYEAHLRWLRAKHAALVTPPAADRDTDGS